MKSRVEFVLEDYVLPVKVVNLIWNRIHRANCNGDDPVAVQIALDTIVESRFTEMAALPEEIASAAEASMIETYEVTFEKQGEILSKALVSDASAQFRHALSTCEKVAARGMLLRGCFILMLVLAFGLIAGAHYAENRIVGLSDTHRQFAVRPEAEFWLALQNANYGVEHYLTDQCSRGSPHVRVDEATNREICTMNLFIQERAPHPGGNGQRLLSGLLWKEWLIGGCLY